MRYLTQLIFKHAPCDECDNLINLSPSGPVHQEIIGRSVESVTRRRALNNVVRRRDSCCYSGGYSISIHVPIESYRIRLPIVRWHWQTVALALWLRGWDFPVRENRVQPIEPTHCFTCRQTDACQQLMIECSMQLRQQRNDASD